MEPNRKVTMAQGTQDEAAQAVLPKDDPMMQAWTRYIGGHSFGNTFQWANYVEIRAGEGGALRAHVPHAQSSLWAAFCAGWKAREVTDAETQAIARQRLVEGG